MITDFNVINYGSIAILKPLSDEAMEWVDEHIPDDAMTWAGGIVVEPRYINDILEGIENDGMTVSHL